MSYSKTTWVTLDVITATKLNNAENGIEATAIVADAALPKAGGTMSNTNLVTNLNADLLDGQQGSYYLPAGTYTAHAAENAIDAHGAMPAVKVTHSVSQSIPDFTYTTLAFNTETYDTDTIHDTVTSNSRLTCKTAGKYLINASLSYVPNATGYRGVNIVLNATTATIASVNVPSIGGIYTSVQATVVYNLAVGDFVEVQAIQTSGGALNIERVIDYSPDFNMVKVG